MKLGNKYGMTLIEILIVIAIIGILASIGIAYYRSQYIIKARLVEVTNTMSIVAGSVARYYMDSDVFPTAGDIAAIRDSLGVSVPSGRISSMSIAGGAASGIITTTITGIDSRVDTRTLTLTASTDTNGAIQWSWGGTVPSNYQPNR